MATIDTQSEQAVLLEGPFIVPPLTHARGGVDFLGLRQVNLDLMAECLPGVSNTTRHIRPFSLLCWIHWKYHRELVEQKRKTAAKRELRLFQEKAETLFTWGHQLRKLRGVPGTNSKCPGGDGGWVELSFDAWKRSPKNTSLQAAVQYGPAMKSRIGLGFAEIVEGGFFHVTSSGETLANALDARLSRSSAYELVGDLSGRKARARDAEELIKAWQVDEPSRKERDHFRSVLFDASRVDEDSSLGIRTATIAAIAEALRASRTGLEEEEIRRAIAWQRIPGGRRVKLGGTSATNSRRWLVLQVRQAQRAALEGFLAWCETRMLNGTRSLDDFHKALLEGLLDEPFSKGGEATCAATLASFQRPFGSEEKYHEACARDSDRCFFSLMDELFEVLDENPLTAVLPASKLLIATLGMTSWLKQAEEELSQAITHGGVDRISLSYQLEHFSRFEDRPFSDFLCDILERWVISQHMSVATRRFDGRSQRLRFAFDEQGLEFLAEKPMEPMVSADHLSATLSLMSESGIVNFDAETGIYTVGD